jgi:hypothetical protein
MSRALAWRMRWRERQRGTGGLCEGNPSPLDVLRFVEGVVQTSGLTSLMWGRRIRRT